MFFMSSPFEIALNGRAKVLAEIIDGDVAVPVGLARFVAARFVFGIVPFFSTRSCASATFTEPPSPWNVPENVSPLGCSNRSVHIFGL